MVLPKHLYRYSKYQILIRIQSEITHKVLFHDKVWVWCIISATKIIELISFQTQ